MNTIFDFKRAGLLIQRHFIERFQSELMFWGIATICMMFLRNNIGGIFGFAIITCVVRTGQFFREIHSPTNQINYFMIPATQIEKFVVSLLYTIVYFWTMMLVVYIIGNISGTFVNNLLANIGLVSDILGIHYSSLDWIMFDSIRNGNDNTFFLVFLAILIIQSIFLLGSIYFKRNQILKTCFVLIILTVFLVIIGAVEAKYFLADTIAKHSEMYELEYGVAYKQGWGAVTKIVSRIFFYLLAPYLLLTSYIRLTEKEV